MSSYDVAKTICGVFNGLRKGSSIIAGGYLRDLDLGRKPHDVDLIIEYEGEEDLKVVRDFASAFGYKAKFVGNGYVGAEVKDVLALTKDGELKIDVIFIKMPVMERLAIFPCNLCKIWTDHTGVIQFKPDYVMGIADREVIYNRGTAREAYIDKMHEYFPDFSHDMESWEANDIKRDRREREKLNWRMPLVEGARIHDEVQVMLDDEGVGYFDADKLIAEHPLDIALAVKEVEDYVAMVHEDEDLEDEEDEEG